MATEIKAPPKFKTLIVRDDNTSEELEKLLNDGWRTAAKDVCQDFIHYTLAK